MAMMKKIRDWFSPRRATRVSVKWMVDLEVPDSNPMHLTGLFALDMSAQGIRLEGGNAEQVRKLLSFEGRTWMRLRLPGMKPPLPRLQAELRWGMGETPHFLTGWLFTKPDKEILKLLDEYIVAHPADVIADRS
ncbi:MAG: hypothetical protein ACI906_000215 [Candidatus Latescibacterota bacterium]|jgi:hypothetical protein